MAVQRFRSGDWVTRRRMILYPIALLAVFIGATSQVLLSDAASGTPTVLFKSDFIAFWLAAREVLAGRPFVPYSRELFEPLQDALFPGRGYFWFFYPPHYLLYIAPLGLLSYAVALAAWVAAGFAVASWVIGRIVGHWPLTALLALGFPATYLTVMHGQNGFLAAALFAGGLLLLPRRPLLAGLCFGLLTFKPQLGLLIPLALIIAGQWRTIIAAGLTAAALALASMAAFGPDLWAEFLAAAAAAGESARAGWTGWHKFASFYALFRHYGAGEGAALLAQAAVSIVAAFFVLWAWVPRHAVRHQTKAAMLLVGAVLISPYVLSYDLFLLAPALAFAVRSGTASGWLPFEKSLLALFYLLPILVLAGWAGQAMFAPFVSAAYFIVLTWRTLAEARGRALMKPAVAPAPL